MQNSFIRKTLYVAAVWGCLFLACVAQERSDSIPMQRLPDVEVTEKMRPSVMREAAPLQIMNKATFDRLGIQDVAEAIRHFAGATVKDYGGIGGLKTVSIRNFGVQHTAVSYDGIAVSDVQSGQVDISRFSLDHIENLSLAIGQTDHIFQPARMFASVGILDIQTVSPVFREKNSRTSLKIKGGSFGLFAPSVRYEQRISNKLSASAHADWLSAKGNYPFTLTNGQTVTDEKRKNSDIQSLRLEGNIYGNWDEKGTLNLKIYHYHSERGLPGSVVLYNDYNRERLWDRNTFIQAYYRRTAGTTFYWQARAKFNHAWNRYVDINNKYESGRQEDRHLQREYYASGSGLYMPTEKINLSLSTDFSVNTLHNNVPACPFPTRYTSLTAFAAQYKDDRFTATGSLLGTYITERVETGERPSDRKRLSPAVSVSWRMFADQNIRFRASYKDIFRVPTFNDLYYLRIGNTDLKPEKATQYNLGLTWGGRINGWLRYLSLSVDGYHNRVSDKIIALPTLYIWKMMNFGEVSVYGTDVLLNTEILLHKDVCLFVQGAYSWQKAIDVTDESAKNYRHQIPYTPRHSGSASLTVENPWVCVSYQLTAVDKRYALPQNIKDNQINGYVEQSVSLNKEFDLKGVDVRLQGEVINIGNTQYDVIQYYPMPGRAYRFTVKFTI